MWLPVDFGRKLKTTTPSTQRVGTRTRRILYTCVLGLRFHRKKYGARLLEAIRKRQQDSGFQVLVTRCLFSLFLVPGYLRPQAVHSGLYVRSILLSFSSVSLPRLLLPSISTRFIHFRSIHVAERSSPVLQLVADINLFTRVESFVLISMKLDALFPTVEFVFPFVPIFSSSSPEFSVHSIFKTF